MYKRQVWHHFRPDSLLYDLDHVADWLDEHWQELSVRPEMRSHRMLQKRVQCLHDFARYAVETQLMYKDYDTIWQDSQQKVKYYGRYMAIKYLELLHRMTNKRSFASYDIRAKHAWSPRKTLGILFPENMHILANRYDNSDSAVTLSEAVATIAKNRLRDEGVEVSYFQLQVMLCEFKEFLEGGYYPGASHDEEMDYMAKSSSFDMTPIWEARAALFPHEYLGEFGGWSGIRKDRLR